MWCFLGKLADKSTTWRKKEESWSKLLTVEKILDFEGETTGACNSFLQQQMRVRATVSFPEKQPEQICSYLLYICQRQRETGRYSGVISCVCRFIAHVTLCCTLQRCSDVPMIFRDYDKDLKSSSLMKSLIFVTRNNSDLYPSSAILHQDFSKDQKMLCASKVVLIGVSPLLLGERG